MGLPEGVPKRWGLLSLLYFKDGKMIYFLSNHIIFYFLVASTGIYMNYIDSLIFVWVHI